MSHEVVMPVLGMNQDSGVIAKWHKALGDKVKSGDVLMDVETDKAIMEIEAKKDGYLSTVNYEAGVDIPVGEVVAIISDDGLKQTPVSENKASKTDNTDKTPIPKTPLPNKILSNEQSAKRIVPLEKKHRTLASPKAKTLAIQHGIQIDTIAKETGFPILHAKDVMHFVSQRETKPEIHTSLYQAPSSHIQMTVNPREFYACLEHLLQKSETQNKTGGHLIAVLAWVLLQKYSVIKHNKLDSAIKVTSWDGKALNASTLATANIRTFLTLEVHEALPLDTLFEVICLNGSHIHGLDITNVHSPSIISFEKDNQMSLTLLGFETTELSQYLSFSEALAQSIEHPLIHLI